MKKITKIKHKNGWTAHKIRWMKKLCQKNLLNLSSFWAKFSSLMRGSGYVTLVLSRKRSRAVKYRVKASWNCASELRKNIKNANFIGVGLVGLDNQ